MCLTACFYNILSHSIESQATHQEETTTRFSPSVVCTSTLYETRRRVGSGHSDTHGRSSRDPLLNEPLVEEKYEVTVSSKYDESGLKAISPQLLIAATNANERYLIVLKFRLKKITFCHFVRFELNEEIYVACVVVNESLYDSHVDRKKAVRLGTVWSLSR